MPGSISGAGLDPRRQLEERDDRAGESHGADEDADDDLGVVDAEQVLRLGLRLPFASTEVAVPADQHGGETDEAVQQRDQLRHPGHLDDAGAPEADRGADGRGSEQKPELDPGHCLAMLVRTCRVRPDNRPYGGEQRQAPCRRCRS